MNITTITYQKLSHTLSLLRLTYGLLFLIAGADKFAKIISDWPKYISPIVVNTLHVPAPVILYVAAIFELGLCFLILTHWPRIGGYLASLWLIAIALNYFSMHEFIALGICNIALAVGALTLGRLVTIKERITNEDIS